MNDNIEWIEGNNKHIYRVYSVLISSSIQSRTHEEDKRDALKGKNETQTTTTKKSVQKWECVCHAK